MKQNKKIGNGNGQHKQSYSIKIKTQKPNIKEKGVFHL